MDKKDQGSIEQGQGSYDLLIPMTSLSLLNLVSTKEAILITGEISTVKKFGYMKKLYEFTVLLFLADTVTDKHRIISLSVL